MKPRVMSLVVFTALVGLVVAPGHLHPVIGFTALLCIAVGAGAAGALNMWYDADIDARDDAHRQPSDPAGRVHAGRGARLRPDARGRSRWWCSACWSTGSRPALLAFTIFFYVVVYTMWLKRSTPQNIVIGGAAGAFPPMIGWAAATGALSARAGPAVPHHLLLDAAAFLGAGAAIAPTTMPAPACRCCRWSPATPSTRRQILLYTLVLVPVGVAPWLLGYAGAIYGVTALVGRRDHAGARAGRCCASGRAGASARSRQSVRLLDPLSVPAVRGAAGRRGWGGLIARLAA